MASRIHQLPGSHNVRDLGGLATADGGQVRSGQIFRSDYPGFAEHDGGRLARDLGLRTVVDLRRGAEAAFELVDWAALGIAHERWPIVADVESSWHARYAAYLTARPETVVGAVRRVLDPTSQPVLFHCAAGKDRTGVVAALVLGTLGVADQDVVDDYVLSDASVAAILARLVEAEPYRDRLRTTTWDDQRPRAAGMEQFLEALHQQGGAREWLVRHGMTEAELTSACQALVER